MTRSLSLFFILFRDKNERREKGEKKQALVSRSLPIRYPKSREKGMEAYLPRAGVVVGLGAGDETFRHVIWDTMMTLCAHGARREKQSRFRHGVRFSREVG